MATTNVTEATFGQVIEEHPIVFVDFWAPWFGPSKEFEEIYETVAAANPDLVFARVDTQEQQQLAAAANVTSIPTLMAYRDRVLVYSEPGPMTLEQLNDLVDAVRAIDMSEVRAAEQDEAGAER